jgi:hypothetical protein
MWVYAARIGHLIGPWVTPQMATFITYRAATVPVVFALSIPIAIVFGAYAAEATWVLSFPIQALITRRFRIERTSERAGGPRSAAAGLAFGPHTSRRRCRTRR